jgi:hypothetical protein
MEREQWAPTAEVGLKHLENWSLEARDFVDKARAGSLTELVDVKSRPVEKHPFLQRKCHRAQLVRLIVPANIMTHTFWKGREKSDGVLE